MSNQASAVMLYFCCAQDDNVGCLLCSIVQKRTHKCNIMILYSVASPPLALPIYPFSLYVMNIAGCVVWIVRSHWVHDLPMPGQMDRGNENPTQRLPWWLRKTTKKPQSGWPATGFEPRNSRMRVSCVTTEPPRSVNLLFGRAKYFYSGNWKECCTCMRVCVCNLQAHLHDRN